MMEAAMKLAPDIDIRHLSGPQWSNLLTLFAPTPRIKRGDSDRAFVLRVTHGGAVVKLWHSTLGRLATSECTGRETVEVLSERFEGARVLSTTTDALTTLASRWQKQIDYSVDFFDQIFSLISMFPQTQGLTVYPSPGWLSLPGFLRSTLLNVFLPKNRCLVFLITHNGQVWTSVIARHGPKGLDVLVSSEAFFDNIPENVEPSWIAELCRGVQDQYGEIHGAVAMDWTAFWNLRRQPTRALLNELEKQQLIVKAHWPMSWNFGLWTLEQKHKHKLKTMSQEEQQLRNRPLSEKELRQLL
jgi:hypothetical protein